MNLLHDVRYALRLLIKDRWFTLVAVTALALGIGVNATVFTFVNAVLIRGLPFDEPDRLMRLFHIPPQSTFPGMATFSLSPANFLDWQRASRSFERVGASAGIDRPLQIQPRAVIVGNVGIDDLRRAAGQRDGELGHVVGPGVASLHRDRWPVRRLPAGDPVGEVAEDHRTRVDDLFEKLRDGFTD